ncbi:MAG: hypothetical protein U5L45_08005 [Saprospiraceae bacterium]|nr:hypothetical protein [Saprospiraceae bacterium]
MVRFSGFTRKMNHIPPFCASEASAKFANFKLVKTIQLRLSENQKTQKKNLIFFIIKFVCQKKADYQSVIIFF